MAKAVPLPGASGLIGPATQVTYLGFAVKEAAASTAHFRIRDGSVTGTILETISLASGESATAFYGPDGIHTDGQLYVQIVSGTLEGSVRYR